MQDHSDHILSSYAYKSHYLLTESNRAELMKLPMIPSSSSATKKNCGKGNQTVSLLFFCVCVCAFLSTRGSCMANKSVAFVVSTIEKICFFNAKTLNKTGLKITVSCGTRKLGGDFARHKLVCRYWF